MRIATWNIEWFTELFSDADELLRDDAWSARYNVTRAMQADAVTTVLSALDADAVLVVEAPDTNGKRSTTKALEGFAAHYGLRISEAVSGFANDTQQEIAVLFDPKMLQVVHAPRDGTPGVPRFDGQFEIDLDVDAVRDKVRFSKPPLELDVVTRKGTALHLIGAHLKSKAPHGARNDAEVMRIAIANRRKQLAQAIWLRARIDQIRAEGTSVMVLGDLNDGPGLDEFEGLFGRSSVEIVLGSEPQGQLFDPHAQAALTEGSGTGLSTARFLIRPENRTLEALLDYIMISEDLRALNPVWRIWHPLTDPGCASDPALREALLTASDHFPVTIDLDI